MTDLESAWICFFWRRLLVPPPHTHTHTPWAVHRHHSPHLQARSHSCLRAPSVVSMATPTSMSHTSGTCGASCGESQPGHVSIKWNSHADTHAHTQRHTHTHKNTNPQQMTMTLINCIKCVISSLGMPGLGDTEPMRPDEPLQRYSN